MKTFCYNQISFESPFNREFIADFAGGRPLGKIESNQETFLSFR